MAWTSDYVVGSCVYSQADWQEGGRVGSRHLHMNSVGIFNTSEFPQTTLYDQFKCADYDSEINLVAYVAIFPL